MRIELEDLRRRSHPLYPGSPVLTRAPPPPAEFFRGMCGQIPSLGHAHLIHLHHLSCFSALRVISLLLLSSMRTGIASCSGTTLRQVHSG